LFAMKGIDGPQEVFALVDGPQDTWHATSDGNGIRRQ
jgi:hypothetical protein